VEIAIAGLPRAGKTTVFNALARAQADVATFGAGGVNRAVVKVPDDRLDRLATLFKPRKLTHAEVRYVDLPGWERPGQERRETIPPAVLGALRQADALAVVVRAFANDAVPPALGAVDAVREAQTVSAEFALADLLVVERRRERLERELRSAAAAERALRVQELALMERLHTQLEAGQPVRSLDLSADEEKLLRGFGLLTAKPTLVIVNAGDDLAASAAAADATRAVVAAPRTTVLVLAGRLEMELAQMDDEEARAFREAYGLGEAGLAQAIRASYALLDLISFFTVGEDECRAWTVARGTTALGAAGAIHSDLARGFIRAEVVRWDELLDAGSLAEARKRALLRAEGKQYEVQDGDVITILFNV
jgi:GTP-binding protein YchF